MNSRQKLINQIPPLLKKEIRYLKKIQQPDGNFEALSSARPDRFFKTIPYPLNLPASLTVYAINSLTAISSPATIRSIQKKAVNFLLTQKSPRWSFNYWGREHKLSREWPDNLDDTACALLALYTYDPKLVTGQALASLVALLTQVEAQEGGPYRTWLVAAGSNQAWMDIDLAVNANIGFFLALQEVDLLNLTRFADQMIKANKLESPYYTLHFTLYYVSRFYQGQQKPALIRALLRRKNKQHHWGNSLDTALAVSALLNLGYPPARLEPGLRYLIKSLRSPNAKVQMFCRCLSQGKAPYFAISTGASTAIILEALGKFYLASTAGNQRNAQGQASARAQSPSAVNTPTGQKPVPPLNQQQRKIKTRIEQLARARFQQLEPQLRQPALKVLKKLALRDDRGLVTLTPYFFARALNPQLARKFNPALLARLGLANLCGWLAYTIYDDFLDDEGQPPLLPLANLGLREAILGFTQDAPDQFRPVLNDIMDQLESANAWEAGHCRAAIKDSRLQLPCRLPDYKNYERLAHRSLGHALGPLALLSQLNYRSRRQQTADLDSTRSFFEHFIIARQINDDLHDWEKDLANGQLNPVVAAVVKKWQQKDGRQKTGRPKPGSQKQSAKSDTLDLKKELPRLQEIFWYEIVPNFCRGIEKQIKLARQHLAKISVLKTSDAPSRSASLAALLIPLENAASKTQIERDKTLEFLNTLQWKSSSSSTKTTKKSAKPKK